MFQVQLLSNKSGNNLRQFEVMRILNDCIIITGNSLICANIYKNRNQVKVDETDP